MIFTHPGSRGQKGTGSRIRIRNTEFIYITVWPLDLNGMIPNFYIMYGTVYQGKTDENIIAINQAYLYQKEEIWFGPWKKIIKHSNWPERCPKDIASTCFKFFKHLLNLPILPLNQDEKQIQVCIFSFTLMIKSSSTVCRETENSAGILDQSKGC